jgi:predicted CoA-binding protein
MFDVAADAPAVDHTQRYPQSASNRFRPERPGATMTDDLPDAAKPSPPGVRPGPSTVRLLDDQGIFDLLRSARRIAVVGASSNPARPSFGVFRTLISAGYECVPVNPNESAVLGIPAVDTLAEAALMGLIDIVDVFRRSELTEEIARDAVAIGARALWLQLGVINWESARIAADGGLAVVMDRCPAIELRRMG